MGARQRLLDGRGTAFHARRDREALMVLSSVSAGRLRACWRWLLLIYATTTILLGWWPWNLLLLALIAAPPAKADDT
jgi:hypothetical protein